MQRSGWSIGMRVFLATGLIVLTAGAGLYLARLSIAEWLIERYLAAHDAPSHVSVFALGSDRILAALQIGRSDAPDLSVRTLDIGISWNDLTPRIARVQMDAPVLRASYRRGRLDLGTVSALIRSLSRAAPKASFSLSGLPDIIVNHATLLLAAQGGALHLDGHGAVQDGHLITLKLAAGASHLRGPGWTVDLRRADLSLTGGRLTVTALGAFNLRSGAASVSTGQTHIAVSAKGLSPNALLSGAATTILAQARISSDRLSLQNVMSMPLQLDLTAEGAIASGRLRSVGFSLKGQGGVARKAIDHLLSVLPPVAHDRRLITALSGMMAAFRIDVPSAQLVVSDTTRLLLVAPAALSGNGVRVQIAPLSNPLIRWSPTEVSGAGAVSLSGRGVPTIAFALPSLAVQNRAGGKGQASLKFTGLFSLAGVRNAALSAEGHGSWHGGEITFALDRCARIRADRIVQRGKPVAVRLSSELCAFGTAPLFAMGREGWKVQALLRRVFADLPAAAVKLSNASGELTWSGGKTGQDLHLRGGSAEIADTAPKPRFAPLHASGGLALTGQRARGEFFIDGAGARLGSVEVTGRLLEGEGRALIHLRPLKFSPHGLQPAALSALLSPLQRVSGTMEFSGTIAWHGTHLSSAGTLVLKDLDFLSPAGMVHNAQGEIRLVSLLPPRTAPGQRMTVERVDSTVPVSGIEMRFALDGSTLHLDFAKADVGKGEASLAPITVSLAERSSTDGVLHLNQLDLEPLLSASNLADKIKTDVVVSGAIPFRIGLNGITFTQGQLASVGGGHLSIDPSLWSGNQGSAQDNAVRSFAYQALQHLKIDTLEASVNSLPGGRLGLILHIKGHNDPPSPKPAEVGVISLLNGSAFNTSIPLPAGTEVNLTLDTSLNFAQLLAAYQRAWAEALQSAAPAK